MRRLGGDSAARSKPQGKVGKWEIWGRTDLENISEGGPQGKRLVLVQSGGLWSGSVISKHPRNYLGLMLFAPLC